MGGYSNRSKGLVETIPRHRTELTVIEATVFADYSHRLMTRPRVIEATAKGAVTSVARQYWLPDDRKRQLRRVLRRVMH